MQFKYCIPKVVRTLKRIEMSRSTRSWNLNGFWLRTGPQTFSSNRAGLTTYEEEIIFTGTWSVVIVRNRFVFLLLHNIRRVVFVVWIKPKPGFFIGFYRMVFPCFTFSNSVVIYCTWQHEYIKVITWVHLFTRNATKKIIED